MSPRRHRDAGALRSDQPARTDRTSAASRPRRRLITTLVAAACVPALALLQGPAVQAQPNELTPSGTSGPDREATATGHGGAVSSLDPYATQAGIDILKRGGNAVDAAVATSAMLGLTRPYDGSIGGGGYLVIYSADSGEITTVDARETAPAAVEPDVFIDPETGEEIPFTERRVSGLSVGVPGLVRGWEMALDEHGSMPLARLLKPSIFTAENGFVVDEEYERRTEDNIDILRDFTSSRDTFLVDDGEAPEAGSVFTNPELADTYRMLARGGSSTFYDGATAEAIADTVSDPPVHPDADREVRAGEMEASDVSEYQPIERAPTHSTYRGYDIYGMAPSSSGGSTVGESLNILEGFELGEATREEALHRLIESSALSFADRSAYLGDGDFVDVPLEGLLSKEYADTRRDQIGDEASPKPVEAGDPWPYDEGDGEPGVTVTDSADGSTTHLTVTDADGNVVSFTFTIESITGSGIAVPGHGFLLNNELTDFSADPEDPANAPAGGKRPRSSMSPTIVVEDGEPVMALGSPGGMRIIAAVNQVLVNHIDHDMTLPEAIAAPRLASLNDEAIDAEPELLASEEAVGLAERGHELSEMATVGNVTGVTLLPDGRVQAAAEPERLGGGSAMVVHESED